MAAYHALDRLAIHTLRLQPLPHRDELIQLHRDLSVALLDEYIAKLHVPMAQVVQVDEFVKIEEAILILVGGVIGGVGGMDASCRVVEICRREMCGEGLCGAEDCISDWDCSENLGLKLLWCMRARKMPLRIACTT